MAWVKQCTPQAKRIVMDIFRKHEAASLTENLNPALSTREVYDRAMAYDEHTIAHIPERPVSMQHRKKSGKTVTKSWPPHAEHPIRSVRCVSCLLCTMLNIYAA